MFATPEQFTKFAQGQVEAAVALGQKNVAHLESFFALQSNAAKALMEDGIAQSKQLFAAKDAQGLIATATAMAQPAAEKAVAYQRHLATAFSAGQADVLAFADAQAEKTSKAVSSFIDEAAKNAPAGSETVIAAAKNAAATLQNVYEQGAKATRKAIEVVEANLEQAANVVAKSAPAARAAKK